MKKIRNFINRHKTVVVATVIVVIVVGFAGYLFEAKESYHSIGNQANEELLAGNNSEARSLLQERLESSDLSTQDRSDAYQRIAETYVNEGNYVDALSAYQSAEQLTPNDIAVLDSISQTAEQLNDFTTAIEYERKASEIAKKQLQEANAPTSPPDSDENLFTNNQRIKRLEEQRESLSYSEPIAIALAKGKSLRNVGEYNRSIAFYQEAKKQLSDQNSEQFKDKISEIESIIDGLENMQ